MLPRNQKYVCQRVIELEIKGKLEDIIICS